MFYSRTLNNRINRIHERAQRLVFNDYENTFQTLLSREKSFTVHKNNIQALAIELFKVVKGMSPEIMREIFPVKKELKYCTKQVFEMGNIHTVRYGLETVSHLGPKIWPTIPDELKSLTTVKSFMRSTRKWKPTKCPCNLCKICVAGVGYVVPNE